MRLNFPRLLGMGVKPVLFSIVKRNLETLNVALVTADSTRQKGYNVNFLATSNSPLGFVCILLSNPSKVSRTLNSYQDLSCVFFPGFQE